LRCLMNRDGRCIPRVDGLQSSKRRRLTHHQFELECADVGIGADHTREAGTALVLGETGRIVCLDRRTQRRQRVRPVGPPLYSSDESRGSA
jgi:hypothetical protein